MLEKNPSAIVDFFRYSKIILRFLCIFAFYVYLISSRFHRAFWKESYFILLFIQIDN